MLIFSFNKFHVYNIFTSFLLPPICHHMVMKNELGIGEDMRLEFKQFKSARIRISQSDIVTIDTALSI
jgi:hypothetical protein